MLSKRFQRLNIHRVACKKMTAKEIRSLIVMSASVQATKKATERSGIYIYVIPCMCLRLTCAHKKARFQQGREISEATIESF